MYHQLYALCLCEQEHGERRKARKKNTNQSWSIVPLTLKRPLSHPNTHVSVSEKKINLFIPTLDPPKLPKIPNSSAKAVSSQVFILKPFCSISLLSGKKN